MLRANEGKMINTVAMSSLAMIVLISELVWLSTGEVKTNERPRIPNKIDAQMKIRVAIFCILSL